MLNRIKLKLATILIFTLCTGSANSDYVDIGYNQALKIETRFHADNFIVGADSLGNIDVGYGIRDNNITFYAGLGEKYIYSQLIYKNERHSIYDVSLKYDGYEPQVTLGFTLLTSDTFGYVIRLNETESYIGLRKWID